MTALEQKAANVWHAMVDHAMPAHLALQFVAEHADGDRTKALAELLSQAVCATAHSRPSVVQDLVATEADYEAGAIGLAMLRQQFDAAERLRGQIANKLVQQEIRGDASAGPWLDWCEHVARAIDLCRALAAAATAHQEQPK